MSWLAYCLAKPGAWRDEPWEGDVVAKVGPKIFAFLGSGDPERSIGLKCGDREAADLWLERYPGIATASAYIGRYGWNSFTLDGTIPDDEIAELVDRSYEQVVSRLPRSLRP
jgi:predicted DNA-binding protein (MmcQ/YjbR family)